MNPDSSRPARAAELMAAVSAGAFGWLVAHTLNFWIIAHSHPNDLAQGVRHVHELTAAATIAGCLAVASLLAAAIVVVPSKTRRGEQRRGYGPRIQAAAAASTVAFLAADVIEHALLDLPRTPPALLLFGACLHAVFGVGVSLSWLRLLDHITAPNWPSGHHSEPATHHPGRPGPHLWCRHRLLLAYAITGRGPPRSVHA
jgi:hypothetical protein